MNLLVEILGIDFNIGALISFLVGILAGFVILFLLYLYAVIRNFNRKSRIKLSKEDAIDAEEIKILILDAQAEFKDKDKKKELGYVKHLTDICKLLAADIAKKYFPKSKYPYLEITVDESLQIGHYVIDRINELLDAKILRMFKGMTFKQIASLNDTKKKVDDNKHIKNIKNAGLQKIYKVAAQTINVVNPVYWFRKIIMDNAIKIIMNRLGLAAISIVGEETYKIFSKKVLQNDDLALDINALYAEIEKEMKEVTMDEEKKK